MADPLSITASVIAVVTAAIQAAITLKDTVQRYRGRDNTLQRLQEYLEDLIALLKALEDIQALETSMLSLLQGPVSRCAQICHEFEISMKRFHSESRAGFRDWMKLEFMKGNINDFMDSLVGYKSTIAIGLGIITIQKTKASEDVLEKYNEMIHDTTYSLKLHLQRIDEKLALLSGGTSNSSEKPDLTDEKAVTEQCIRICEDAKSYLESIIVKEPSLQEDTLPRPSLQEDTLPQPSHDPLLVFEAQRITRKAMDNYRDSLVETIGRLRERSENLNTQGSPSTDLEKSRLQSDIETFKQCLEVCKIASHEVASQKIHTIGEAVAEEDSDQVVVTTLADLFDVRKAFSRGRSAQLVGSMTDETLRQISGDRYGSRFGALSEGRPSQKAKADAPHQSSRVAKQSGLVERIAMASPNEVRKRSASRAQDMEK